MRRSLIFAAFVGGLILAACGPTISSSPPATFATGFTSLPPGWTGLQLTAGNGGFQLATDGTTATLTAQDTSGQQRAAFWEEQQPAQDGQVCATWNGTADRLPQQGLALRVQTDGNPRQAITVTKNIFGATPDTAVENVNINRWTVTPTGHTLVTDVIPFADVVAPDGNLLPFPWTVCARAQGATIAIDVEPTATPPAPFTNQANVRTDPLPDGWTYPGAFGWYDGHQQDGGTSTITNLSVLPL